MNTQKQEIVSWGGFQYFKENIEKLQESIAIKYVYKSKQDLEGFLYLEKSEQILKLENPFVVISLAKVSDVEEATKWCNKYNIPFCHAQFLIGNGRYDMKYIKAVGGKYTDKRGNRIEIHKNAAGNIIIETSEACNGSIKIGDVKVTDKLHIKIMGEKPQFELGDKTTIFSVNAIVNSDGVIAIGKDCMISHTVSLMQSDQHLIFDAETNKRINHPKNIVIGNHVWLGRECELLGGAEIGNNSIVGAKAITSGKFPSNVIIAGCPAKIIREGIIWARDNIKDSNGIQSYELCKDQGARQYEESIERKPSSQKEIVTETLEEIIIGFYQNGYSREQIADYIEQRYGQYYRRPQ